MLEQVAVFTVFALVLARLGSGRWVEAGGGRLGSARAFLFFGGLSVLGTYLGVEVQGALANCRAIGAVLAGLYGGPGLGLAVGAAAGLHRYTVGGFTAGACALSTVLEGLVGGLAYRAGRSNGRWLPAQMPWLALTATLVAETVQMATILAVARPFSAAWNLIGEIGLPMIAMNSVGAWLFATVLLDQSRLRERLADRATRRALQVAEGAIDALEDGLTEGSGSVLAETLLRDLPVSAVAVTDTERVIGFAGLGADHHRVGDSIRSVLDQETPTSQPAHRASRPGPKRPLEVALRPFSCGRPGCPLHQVLIVPLTVENEAVGTIALFEPQTSPWGRTHEAFGAGLARILSEQLLRHRVQAQRKLLSHSELKLLQAQVKPHFLFNALNAIRAVVRVDAKQGRALITHLSDFLRTNLKRADPEVTFREELNHVRAYLALEQARFGDRLQVIEEIAPEVLDLMVPTFSLQPLVENAIKHGVKDLLDGAEVRIRAELWCGEVLVHVEDNGGCFETESQSKDGMGLAVVHRRSQLVKGHRYGVSIQCDPGRLTRVTLRLPAAQTPPVEVPA